MQLHLPNILLKYFWKTTIQELFDNPQPDIILIDIPSSAIKILLLFIIYYLLLYPGHKLPWVPLLAAEAETSLQTTTSSETGGGPRYERHHCLYTWCQLPFFKNQYLPRHSAYNYA